VFCYVITTFGPNTVAGWSHNQNLLLTHRVTALSSRRSFVK